MPFERVHLAGFVPIKGNDHEMEPAARRIKRELKDGEYLVDNAEAGEIRFEFATALTGPEASALDALLATHNSTQRTAGQQRTKQDATDLITLENQYPNIAGMNNSQLRQYISLLARVTIRDLKNVAI